MQLMVNSSLRKQNTLGFGWLNGKFKKIKTNGLDYLGQRI